MTFVLVWEIDGPVIEPGAAVVNAGERAMMRTIFEFGSWRPDWRYPASHAA
jgi:hypothetical protein